MEDNIFFHPPISSIPWAFVLIAALIEIASLFYSKRRIQFQEFSRVLTLVAALGSIFAFLSGLLASQGMPDNVSEMLEEHFELGRMSMFACIGVGMLATLLPVAEKTIQPKIRWVFRLCLFGTVILIALTGHEGNELRETRIKSSFAAGNSKNF